MVLSRWPMVLTNLDTMRAERALSRAERVAIEALDGALRRL